MQPAWHLIAKNYSEPLLDIPSYKKSTVLLTNLLIPNFLGFKKLANKTTETITRPILDIKAKSTKPGKTSTLNTSFICFLVILIPQLKYLIQRLLFSGFFIGIWFTHSYKSDQVIRILHI